MKFHLIFKKSSETSPKISERTLRITAASVLAVVMVSAAYLLSGPNFLTNRTANAESSDALLKAYATKDTDGDGLPDWEEALYGTDPNKAISNSFGIPDGQAAREGKLTPNALASQLPSADQGTSTAPLTDADFGGTPAPAPGSITDEFSKEFLREYVQASNGQPMDQATQQQLVTNLLATFTQKAAASFTSSYSAVSIHTDSSVSVSAYSAQVESIIIANDVSPEGSQPLTLMGALIEKGDESARTKLTTLAASYGKISQQLLAAHVPPSLAAQHLALVQGFDELHKTTAASASFEKDPLGTMGAISAFQPASNEIVNAFKGIATVILSTGEPAAGTPGSMIVSIARSTETQ